MKEFLQRSFNEQCELRVPHPFAVFWRMGVIAQCPQRAISNNRLIPRTNIAATLDIEISALFRIPGRVQKDLGISPSEVELYVGIK
jgi:hypothetical protein